MYEFIFWAVETAALLAGRLGDRELAADAFASIDADLAQYGGRPLSGWPSTILYPIRQALERDLRLDEINARPYPIVEMAERLRRRFEQF